MTTLTAEEFKERLKTTHDVANALVKEPITIDFRDGGSFTGDFTIRNCDLKALRIADSQFTSLTIQKGIIRDLTLQTNAQIQRVIINRCAITTLTTTETLIEEFQYHAGVVKTTFTGQFPHLGKLTLSGVMKSIALLNPACSEVNLTNLQATELRMQAMMGTSLHCKNVTCNKISLDYGSGCFENLTCENIISKDLQIITEHVRALKYSGTIKSLSMTTVPEPVPEPVP